jgi:ketosteroid isomerase-like protein
MMKKLLVSFVILGVCVVGLISESMAIAAEKDTDTVRAAATEFYSALNVMFTGDVGPIKEIWSHGDDVTYMGPGGDFLVGWKQILPEWERQAARKLGGKVEPKEMRVTGGRDLAIVSNYEVGENMVDGKPQKVRIRATSMFRNENGKWKMIGHHTDIIPFLQK